MNQIQKNDAIISNYSKPDCEKVRYAMIVEYDGTNFNGSQKQPGQRTVQSEVENAIKTFISQDVCVIFSGRTDKGVHSKGQVVHFDLEKIIDEYKIVHSLNSILPDDISISKLVRVDSYFHSQKSALYRWYRYVINNNAQRSVWLKQSLHVNHKLDIDKINQALCYLKGLHDFSSFKKANSMNPARECYMYHAECKIDAGIIYIDLMANRFLYNMVRIIIGTILQIGQGIYPIEHIKYALEKKDRKFAGPTAKPEGLFFMQVGYKDEYNKLLDIKMEAINYENLFCKAS